MEEIPAFYGPLHKNEWDVVHQLLCGQSRLCPKLTDTLSGDAIFDDLMRHFQNFMELYAVGSVHLLTFWRKAEEFRRKSDDCNCQESCPCDSRNPTAVMNACQEFGISIYSEYICPDSATHVACDADIREEILNKICPHDGRIDHGCFESVKNIVIRKLDQRFFANFLKSAQFRSFIIGIIVNGSFNIADVINHAQSLDKFVEFIESIGAITIMQFTLSALHFEAQWNHACKAGSYDAIWAQNDAVAIYDQYISLQAKRSIRCSNRLRSLVEESICVDDGDVQPNCFRVVLVPCIQKLTQVLELFLKSNQFAVLMNELGIPWAMDTKQSRRTLPVKRETSLNILRRSAAPKTASLPPSCNGSFDHDLGHIPSQTSSGTSKVRSGSRSRASSTDRSSQDAGSSSGTHPSSRSMTIGHIDALGRFVLYSEKPPPGEAKAFAKLSEKLSRTEKQKRQEEEAALEAQRIIEETLSQCLVIADPTLEP